MPDFKIIETETKDDVYIEVNSQYNNLNANKVTVAKNIKARLFGTINELLVIEEGAQVNFHGTIKGKIENKGELFLH